MYWKQQIGSKTNKIKHSYEFTVSHVYTIGMDYFAILFKFTFQSENFTLIY